MMTEARKLIPGFVVLREKDRLLSVRLFCIRLDVWQ